MLTLQVHVFLYCILPVNQSDGPAVLHNQAETDCKDQPGKLSILETWDALLLALISGHNVVLLLERLCIC